MCVGVGEKTFFSEANLATCPTANCSTHFSRMQKWRRNGTNKQEPFFPLNRDDHNSATLLLPHCQQNKTKQKGLFSLFFAVATRAEKRSPRGRRETACCHPPFVFFRGLANECVCMCSPAVGCYLAVGNGRQWNFPSFPTPYGIYML